MLNFTKEKKVKRNGSQNEIDGETQHLAGKGLNEEEILERTDMPVYKFDYEIDKGVLFLTEILRLYCNEEVFEFKEDIIKMKSEKKLNIIILQSNQIKAIMTLIGKTNRHLSKDDPNFSNYVELFLKGILKIFYKFLKGLTYEVSINRLQETGISEVFQGMMDFLPGELAKILPQIQPVRGEGIAHDLSGLLDQYLRIERTGSESGSSRDYDKRGRSYELKDDSVILGDKKTTATKRADIIEKILMKIQGIYKIYKRRDIIKELKRESHIYLQDHPTRMFDEINDMGSRSLKRLKDLYKETKSKYMTHKEEQQGGFEDVRSNQIRNKKVYSKLDKQDTSKSSVMDSSRETTNDCAMMINYIKRKESYLHDENNLFYKVMEEGGDDGTESEQFYKLLLKWIIEIFYKKMNPDSAKGSHPDSYVSKILREFDVYCWIHILDNLLNFKPITKEIFFDKFFAESFQLKKKILSEDIDTPTALIDFENHAQKNNIVEGFGFLATKIATGEINTATLNNESKIEDAINLFAKENKSEKSTSKKKKKIMKADVFIGSIFESVFYLQKCIRSEVFSRTSSVNLEYFFSLSGLIKTLAEDNFMQFKELVGRMRKEFDKNKMRQRYNNNQDNDDEEGNNKNRKLTKNFLDIYFLGVHLHIKTNSHVETLVRKDRPHLFWYNIVTLDTLAEYFNGPCTYNQENCLKNFTRLLNFIRRLNSNESSTFYLLQLEVITLVQALFEGESKQKCRIINKNFKPLEFYNMIVKHLRKVYTYYMRRKGRFIDSKDDEEIKKKKLSKLDLYLNSKKLRTKLLKYYQKIKDFQDHPILNIAVGLYIIMSTIGKANNNNYRKFLSEKNVEMGVKLHNSSDLKLTQNERAKISQELSSQKSNFFGGLYYFSSKNKAEVNTYDKGRAEREDESHRKEKLLQNLNYFFFLNQITESIEILNTERKPVTVFFKVLPECSYLTDETKKLFMEECSIDDASTKLMDLMSHTRNFRVEMESNIKLFREIGRASYFATESTFFNMMKITWSISVLLNFAVVMGYRWEDNPDGSQGVFITRDPYALIIKIISFCLIFISLVFLIIWIFFKWEFAVKKAAGSFPKNVKRNIKYYFQKYILKSFIYQSIPMMFLLHIIFTSIGLTDKPLFYSFNLHCLFFLSKTAQYVVTAITGHFDQVSMTFLVGVLITYSFAIINAQDFRGGWDPLTAGDLDMCKTMLGCFGYVLDFGLRNGGGIADSHDTVAFYGEEGGYTFWYKIMFNMLFFILISKFVLDIIFGIIVDSFTDMRDNQQKRSKLFFKLKFF